MELEQTIKPGRLTAGQPIRAKLIQRVPVGGGLYLPNKVEVVGRVVNCSPSSLSILFTKLRWKDQTVPIHVQLVSAASPEDVFQASMPEGSTDRSTSDPANWTTKQVGGDEIYRFAGSGGVYDQYSQPVGYATLQGVYQSPSPQGGLPRAMGPFSTAAAGLYGLPRFSILSAGDAGTPITLGVSEPKWQLARGTALLLKVIPSSG